MNRLDPNQVEKLQAISTQLRQAREKQGMTLEQLAAKTYISMGALRALDAGQVDLLPEPVFIQGFIRRYGDTVHLDGTALAQTFPLEALPPPPPENSEESTLDTKSSVAEKAERSRLIGLAGGTALAIAVLLLGSMALLNRAKTVAPNPQAEPLTPKAAAPKAATPKVIASKAAAPKASSTQAQKQAPKPVASPKPATAQPQKKSTQPVAVPSQPSASPSSAAPIEAALNLTQESWVQVIVDGKTAFEGTLPQGTKRTWTAKKELTLLAGNAGGVVVAVNRNAAKPLGQVGEVKEVTFTPDSLAQPTQL
uniref:helix-turn-helix domain-containing protein n=1 Tax=Trichocoleus desertorum TaxID=1481672 RepID=UPI0025B608B3|nr:RodZ domain-containing protein [Trichocoleus desertorum]